MRLSLSSTSFSSESVSLGYEACSKKTASAFFNIFSVSAAFKLEKPNLKKEFTVEKGIAKFVVSRLRAFALFTPITSYPSAPFLDVTKRGPPEFPASIGAECCKKKLFFG